MCILANGPSEEYFTLLNYHSDERLQVFLYIINMTLQDRHVLEIIFNRMMISDDGYFSQINLVYASMGQMDDDECEKDLGRDILLFVVTCVLCNFMIAFRGGRSDRRWPSSSVSTNTCLVWAAIIDFAGSFYLYSE